MSQRARILYVDDEKLSHILFKAVFEDHYEVYNALSAHEAIEILRNETIHVLITDQQMPEVTGAELLEAIHDEFPTIGRIMLSAYSDIDAIIQAINTGRIDRYVSKPWEEEPLRAIIDHAFAIYDRRVDRQRRLKELEHQLTHERQLRRELEKHVSFDVIEAVRTAVPPRA